MPDLSMILFVQIHGWCVARRYPTVAAAICRRRGVAAFKAGQLGSSIAWAVKAGDTQLVSRIADRLLRDLFTGSGLDNGLGNGLIDCLKDTNLGVVGKKMTFVIEFAEVQALIAVQKHAEAVRLLRGLLQSQLVSRHSNIDIVRAVRPLIVDGAALTADDVYQLLEVR